MIESAQASLQKVATGIAGFDTITGGGLPAGRVSATIGAAGVGKTVFAVQTLIHRIRESGRVGIFVSFEQSPENALTDMVSFDWGARELVANGRLVLLDGRPRADILVSGTFDLQGLFATIEGAAESGAPACVVFDGVDTLLAMLPSSAMQQSELLRLQDHADRLGETVILTVKEAGSFSHMALYLADCVIALSRDEDDGLSNRALWIQKYRSSSHVQGRVAFVVTERGIEVDVIESRASSAAASSERVSTGIARLDEMFGGGIFRGSSTLLSGAPGTAKTALGTRLLEAACRNGERALGISFDESPSEIVRNVASVGTDLAPHLASGLLCIRGIVDRSAGPDEFVHEIMMLIRQHQPKYLLIDPLSVFTSTTSSLNAVRRLIQHCKSLGLTVALTSLIDRGYVDAESSRSFVSAICDNWVHLSYAVNGGERNRALTIVKARGTWHSNQVGELLLGDGGITIADAYVEDGAVLMGTLRWQRERASQQAIQDAEREATVRYREMEREIEETRRKRGDLDFELDTQRQELDRLRARAAEIDSIEVERRSALSRLRTAPAGGEA